MTANNQFMHHGRGGGEAHAVALLASGQTRRQSDVSLAGAARHRDMMHITLRWRRLVHEIVADVDENNREIVLLIHWAGGRHSELKVKKNKTGQHRWCTSMEAIEVLKQMAGGHTDEQIATTLNRLGFQTGAGHTWNEQRVYSARHTHNLPAYDPQRTRGYLTLEQAAQYLGISANSVRRMIKQDKLPADQAVPCAPWRISVQILDSEAIRQAVLNIKDGSRSPRTQSMQEEESLFSIS